MSENKFSNRSKKRIKETTLKRYSEEFQDKSHFDEWLGMYFSAQIVRTILQALSLLFAIACVAYPAKYFLDYWLLGVPPAVVLLFFLERAKRKTADTGIRKNFTTGTIPAFLLCSAILASCGSIVLSVVGAPLFIAEVAPSPILVDTASINEKYKAEEAKAFAFWQPQIDSSSAKAQAVFSQGNYKGKISGRTKTQKFKHENKANAAQDSLNTKLGILQTEKEEALTSAQTENGTIVKDSKAQTEVVAFWTAVGTFILEVLFYLLSYFCVRFRFVSAEEEGVACDPEEAPKNNPPNNGNKKTNKPKQKEKQSKVEELFADVGQTFGEALNKTQTKEPSAETKQTQQAEEVHYDEVLEENTNETQTKTIVINKSVNHQKPTIHNGKKAIYYVVNKNKKGERIKYYTEGDIRTFISTYTKRVQDAKLEVASARLQKDSSKLQRCVSKLEKNTVKLADWKKNLRNLKEYEPSIA